MKEALFMQNSKSKKSNKKSRMMDKLYGPKYAQHVFRRLEELDPELNRITQEIPYDVFWAREQLSIRDKSLVTVAALIAMGKEEQTKIHMRGFLRSGGTVNDLRNVLIHLAVYCGFPAAMNGFAALKEVTEKIRSTKSAQPAK
ncbi:MAG: carboxymuconolactone decarboxylase family protein [Elusimicrobia bacterium]|nr:carboxymuconolactone decarboxylase family protein [Elusimicrobiota bacterium]